MGSIDAERIAQRLAGLSPSMRDRYLREVVMSMPRQNRLRVERALADQLAQGVRADAWSLAGHISNDCLRAGVPNWPKDGIADWPYTRLLAGKFRDAVTGKSPRQVWNLPAQVGKSFWLRLGMLWALDANPARRLIYVSYGDPPAEEGSQFMRDVARAAHDKLSFELRADARARRRWLTDRGGGVWATSIGGAIAGFGGSVLFDDPLKNWREAHSPARRKYVWDEMRAVLSLRLSEGDFEIVAHTRWHEDDPTGKLRQLVAETGEQWEFVVLPMTAVDADDPIGRAAGEILEPRRFSQTMVDSRKATLGEYLWASLEQQRPSKEEGNLVRRDWWRWDVDRVEIADEWLTSWDMKLKDKRSGDYVCGQAWARIGNTYHLVAQLMGQWSQAHTRVAIALMAVRHPQISAHVVENTGYGPEVMEILREPDANYVISDRIADEVGVLDHERDAVQELLRRGLSGLLPNNPRESKLVRARAVTPLIEAGNVYLWEQGGFGESVVNQWANFTGEAGGRDDIVDTTSQGLTRLRIGEASSQAPPPQQIQPPPITAQRVSPLTAIPRH